MGSWLFSFNKTIYGEADTYSSAHPSCEFPESVRICYNQTVRNNKEQSLLKRENESRNVLSVVALAKEDANVRFERVCGLF